mgnify:CR=1 FL=1
MSQEIPKHLLMMPARDQPSDDFRDVTCRCGDPLRHAPGCPRARLPRALGLAIEPPPAYPGTDEARWRMLGLGLGIAAVLATLALLGV